MTASAETKKPEFRNLLVQVGNRWLRVTIPAKAKVTLGPLLPTANNGTLYLRIYETASKQLACIANVKQFRDLDSIEVAEPTETEGQWVPVSAFDLAARTLLSRLDENVCPECGSRVAEGETCMNCFDPGNFIRQYWVSTTTGTGAMPAKPVKRKARRITP